MILRPTAERSRPEQRGVDLGQVREAWVMISDCHFGVQLINRFTPGFLSYPEAVFLK